MHFVGRGDAAVCTRQEQAVQGRLGMQGGHDTSKREKIETGSGKERGNFGPDTEGGGGGGGL